MAACQLAELLNQNGAGEYELQSNHAEIYDYEYTWGGKEVSAQKLQVELQSRAPDQYCLGVAKLQKGDKKELQTLLQRFSKGTVWKFGKVKLTDDKTAFINTPCRVVIDLRKSHTTALLQSTGFPKAPSPPTTIADILQLKQRQRFDLIAIPAKILGERRSGAGQDIADVRLIDGSKDPRKSATEPVNATLPLTLFFKTGASFASFKDCVARRTPLLFTCLCGNIETNNGSVSVATDKRMSRWAIAVGARCDTMAAMAEELCGENATCADVAQLPAFQPQEAADYSGLPATLSACSLIDLKGDHQGLVGDAAEQLYQLNHVYVVPPSKMDTITTGTNDRLFGVFEVWDYSKKITVGCRSKAMLQLADCTESAEPEKEYKEKHTNGELRHPLLASVRIRIKTKDGPNHTQAAATEHSQASEDSALSALIVEAERCSFSDIPNDSVDAIHGCLAAGPAVTSERFVATSLKNLAPSPFNNMLIEGKPSDKALVLLKFTQRSNGKQMADGFRIVSDNVRDALDPSDSSHYGTIACCTVEKAPDFTAGKDTMHLAIICKVVPANKPHQGADLYIEAMELVASEQTEHAKEMVQQLQRISNINAGNPTTSVTAAWEQRKCRRLQRYPTQR